MIPTDQHITYQLQYRKCGKPTCVTCRKGLGHGPYWYGYWKEGKKLRGGYVGKTPPSDIDPEVRQKAESRIAQQKAKVAVNA